MSSLIIRFTFCIAVFASIILTSNSSTTGGKDKSLTPRIVNGTVARQGEYPWAMAIIHNNLVICTFSLISTKSALGAAHCMHGKDATAFVGKIGNIYLDKADTVRFSKGIPHELYRPEQILNDIGLLILLLEVEITNRVKPIRLPMYHKRFVTDGRIVGWGSLSNATDTNQSSNVLRTATMNIFRGNFINESQEWMYKSFCAGNKDVRPGWGDSGTAMLYGAFSKMFAIGVLSGSSGGCAVGYPSAFASTGHYARWISLRAEGNITFIDPREY